MTSKYLAAALALLISASPALSGNKVIRAVPVDDEFLPITLWIHGGAAGGYEGLIKPVVMNGVVELCGVGIITNIQARSAIKKSMRGAKFTINGQTFVKDISYFNKVKSAGELKSANAYCASSGKAPPRNVDEMDFEWGRATFRN